MSLTRRLVPILLLVAAFVAAWQFGWADQLSWADLSRHAAMLHRLVAEWPILAASTYILAYAVAVALSVPEGAALTVFGGVLFGTTMGGLLAIIGATCGAVALFLIVRNLLADAVAARAGKLIARIRPGLERDGFNYLLAIRLVPVVPFWLVNLAPALVGMRLGPYALATLIGIVPSTFVFASIGAGLAAVLASGGQPDLSEVLSLRVLLPLAALALLVLLPVILRRAKAFGT